jgi:hypothetical protein
LRRIDGVGPPQLASTVTKPVSGAAAIDADSDLRITP